jgi:hypothetical protein
MYNHPQIVIVDTRRCRFDSFWFETMSQAVSVLNRCALPAYDGVVFD